ncbi:MAG: hypothetical protein DME65_14345, partial [Verrucomicrobia bacterium]
AVANNEHYGTSHMSRTLAMNEKVDKPFFHRHTVLGSGYSMLDSNRGNANRFACFIWRPVSSFKHRVARPSLACHFPSASEDAYVTVKRNEVA